MINTSQTCIDLLVLIKLEGLFKIRCQKITLLGNGSWHSINMMNLFGKYLLRNPLHFSLRADE